MKEEKKWPSTLLSRVRYAVGGVVYNVMVVRCHHTTGLRRRAKTQRQHEAPGEFWDKSAGDKSAVTVRGGGWRRGCRGTKTGFEQ